MHMFMEHVDPILGLRFARTYFLSSLAPDNFMKFVRFGDSKTEVCEAGLQCQNDTKTLLFTYLALVKAHGEVSRLFMGGKITVQ